MNLPQASTRREFLAQTGGAIAAVTCAPALHTDAAEQTDTPLIIDCHAHIYGEDEEKYPTIEKPYRPPTGKGTITHLQAEMQKNGVRYVTAIQTSTFYRWDNRFTAEASRANADILVGVCTLDPDDPASPATLEKYTREYNIRGMRSIAARSGRMDDPGVEKLWATAERLEIVINVLVNRDKRSEIEVLCGRHPKLRVVIDHCLNLKAGPDHDAILADMVALAKVPTLHAKLSFMATGSAEEYPFRDLHASCREIIRAYGPQRCVWGSDFPCELWTPKATYAQNLRLFTHELNLDAKTKRHVLGETAKRLWFSRAI